YERSNPGTQSSAKSASCLRSQSCGDEPVGAHRLPDILHLLLADEIKANLNAVLYLVEDRSRTGYATGLAYAFETGCAINSVAVPGAVRAFYDFAQIYGDAKTHATRFGQGFVALSELGLNLERRTHSLCHGVEHGQHAVACHVHDAAMMRLDL